MSDTLGGWPCLLCGGTVTPGSAQHHAGSLCGYASGFINSEQYRPKDVKPAPAVVHAEGVWRIEGFGVAIEAPTLAGVLELAGHIHQLRPAVKR